MIHAKKPIVITAIALVILLGTGLMVVNKNRSSNKIIVQPASQNDNTSGLRVTSADPNQNLFPNSQQSTQSNNQSSSNSNTTSGNSSSSSSTNKPTYTYPTTPAQPTTPATCNEKLKASYAASRDAAIAYENAKHNSWGYGGPIDSSYYADAKAAEDARHNAELANIEANYQTKLASINCS